MRNANEFSSREDASPRKRLANALGGLEASLQDFETDEMRARFDGFRRAMNLVSDNARGCGAQKTSEREPVAH